MRVDWDPDKAAANLRNHGVSFEEASSVFYDPFELSKPDDAHSADEQRWNTIGVSNRLRMVVVVSTERDEELVRIISARKANRAEVQRYEENRKRQTRD
jgi:uncharacterized DUF497 family protein